MIAKRQGLLPQLVASADSELDKAGRATATRPEGTTVDYFNLIDDRDCVVSSEHEELPQP